MKLSEVQLESLAGGAAGELFSRLWDEVLENIQDPNTEAETPRSVTLKVTVKPNKDRESGEIEVATSSKLASPRPIGATIYMGRRDGKLVAVEYDPRQADLFDEHDPAILPLDRREGSHD